MGEGYFQYFHYGLSGWADRTLVRIREQVYGEFLKSFAPAAGETILDVGASENDHVSSNYLERAYPRPESILAMGIRPYASLKRDFPGIQVLCGDARRLPLADASVDYVYSHAVIEHVGSRANQARFLAEALRVCRKGVLVTTPNRWHPVETHTGLPLLHYLPAAWFRGLCRALGKGMYASEETLNLLSAGELKALLPGCRCEIQGIRWLGLVSNLVLIVRKG